MAATTCSCGFGEEYFTLEGGRYLCSVCGGELSADAGRPGIQEVPAAAKRRILVVDDQAFFRMRIRDALEGRNHQVLEAEEGVGAVRMLSQALQDAIRRPADRVSLAILDLNMPGLLDGFQTLGVLKAMDEELPVLVLTASPPTPELLKRLGQLRAKKYLNKSSKNLEELLLRNIDSL